MPSLREPREIRTAWWLGYPHGRRIEHEGRWHHKVNAVSFEGLIAHGCCWT